VATMVDTDTGPTGATDITTGTTVVAITVVATTAEASTAGGLMATVATGIDPTSTGVCPVEID
jgi:hypothetical protein